MTRRSGARTTPASASTGSGEGRLIRDEDGRLFHIPWGRRSVDSFVVSYECSDGFRIMVFPGLVERPAAVVS